MSLSIDEAIKKVLSFLKSIPMAPATVSTTLAAVRMSGITVSAMPYRNSHTKMRLLSQQNS